MDIIIGSVEFVFVRLAAYDGHKSCVEVNVIEKLSIIYMVLGESIVSGSFDLVRSFPALETFSVVFKSDHLVIY